MSEENKQIDINKQIRQNYKKHFANKTSLVSLLMLVITICLGLGFVFPFSLLLTVPLLVVPAFFGFIIENSTINIGLGKPSRIFKSFGLYFKNSFFGGFQVINGLLKFLICYLAMTSILSVIFHFSIGLNDPSYVVIFEKINNVSTNAELMKIIQELQENPTAMLISNLVEIIAFGLSSYFFLHHIITHSFKLCFSLTDKHFVEMRHVNIIHRRAFPNFRKEFYQEYYGSFWLIFSLFVLGYAGGSIIGLTLLNRNGLQCGMIGLFLGTLLAIYFLPYLYDTYQVLYSLESRFYLKAFLELDNTSYFQYKKYLNEKEKEELKINIAIADKLFNPQKEDKQDNKKE